MKRVLTNGYDIFHFLCLSSGPSQVATFKQTDPHVIQILAHSNNKRIARTCTVFANIHKRHPCSPNRLALLFQARSRAGPGTFAWWKFSDQAACRQRRQQPFVRSTGGTCFSKHNTSSLRRYPRRKQAEMGAADRSWRSELEWWHFIHE